MSEQGVRECVRELFEDKALLRTRPFCNGQNTLHDSAIHRPRLIVLTGGPGGGKTTLMRELRAEDTPAQRWLLVPEAAPILFRAGCNSQNKDFQRAVIQLQVAMEEACSRLARPGQVVVCHRGTLDPLAYWLLRGWDEDEFFAFIGMARDKHLRRYDGVLHLQTAAIGAEQSYRRWPDAHRPETLEQACLLDRLCHDGTAQQNGASCAQEGSATCASLRELESAARTGGAARHAGQGAE